MRQIFLAALAAIALVCPRAAFAQFDLSGTITSTTCTGVGGGSVAQETGCMVLNLAPIVASVSVQIVGTYTATLQFEVTNDSANWVSANAYPLPSGAAVTSTANGTGIWQVDTGGAKRFRVRASAYTSTPTVTMAASLDPAVGVSGVGQVQGTTATGAAGAPNPVVVGGTTAGNVQVWAVNSNGTGAVQLQNGSGTGIGNGDGSAATTGLLQQGGKVVAVATAPSTTAVGNAGIYALTEDRIQYVRSWHPNLIHCTVNASTATTITAFGSPCAAPGASKSIYITDIAFSSSAAGGTAADSYPTIKSGTGGTCGTATAVVWGSMVGANGVIVENRSTPIRIAANSEICWIMSTAGTKQIQVSGFIAP